MIDINNLKKFEITEELDSLEGIQIYLSEAFETNNPKYIAHALGVVARSKGMTDLAKKTGIRREQLYQSFSDGGNPTLQSLVAFLGAIGFNLSVTPIQKQAS